MQLQIEKLSFGPHAIAHDKDGRVIFVTGGVPGDTVDATIYKKDKRVWFAFVEAVLEKGNHHRTPPCPYVGLCGGCPWGYVDENLQQSAKQQNLTDALLRTAKLDSALIQRVVLPFIPLQKPWGYRNKIELSVNPTFLESYNETAPLHSRNRQDALNPTQSKDKAAHFSLPDGKAAHSTLPDGKTAHSTPSDKKVARFSLGMRGLDANTFIPLETCHLLPKKFQGLPKKLTGALSYALDTKSAATGAHEFPVHRVGIRASERTGSLELSLWGPPAPMNRQRVADILTDATGATSIVRCLTKGDEKNRHVTKVEVLAGKGFWEEEIAGRHMRFSAPSFAQANTTAAEQLIQCVVTSAQNVARDSINTANQFPERFQNTNGRISSSCAFDLYAGAGTFTLPLAQVFESVDAVEASGSAVKDLRRNLDRTHTQNVIVQGGDAAREFPAIAQEIAPALIVVDPPRSGLASSVIAAITKAKPTCCIYVSCDMQTLARDTRRFLDSGWWQLALVQPFEMFGQTFHTEVIAVFTLNRNTEK